MDIMQFFGVAGILEVRVGHTNVCVKSLHFFGGRSQSPIPIDVNFRILTIIGAS